MNGDPKALFHLKIRLERYDRVTIAGKRYFEPEGVSDGYMLRPVTGLHTPVHYTHAALWQASQARDWDYEPDYFNPDASRARNAREPEMWSNLAADEAAWVYHKYQYVTRFLRYEALGQTNRSKEQIAETLRLIGRDIAECADTQAALARAAAQPAKKKPVRTKRRGPRNKPSSRKKRESFPVPPVRTFARWLKNFERGGGSPWSLRDNYRNVGNARELSSKQLEYVRIGARADLRP